MSKSRPASEAGEPTTPQHHADVMALRARVIEALQSYSVDHAEFGRRFATWLSLHTTDATALLEISSAEHRGEPLTPSRLADRILLSSGATASLINRLEAAGHVQRARVHADRRVVTLSTTPHVDELADEFFAPLQAELDALIARYPPASLIAIEEFLHDLHATMDGVLKNEH